MIPGRSTSVSTAAAAISAVGAVLAAALAGLNLYYTGSRERARWARDTLADLYVVYLEASFESSAAAGWFFRSATGPGTDRTNIDEVKEQISQARATQTSTLTKLRLLAGSSMVDAAIALHGADHQLVEAAINTTADSHEDFLRARELVWARRMAFLSIAKRSLGLRSSVSRDEHQMPSARGAPMANDARPDGRTTEVAVDARPS
jgi:hypothetical protein